MTRSRFGVGLAAVAALALGVWGGSQFRSRPAADSLQIRLGAQSRGSPVIRVAVTPAAVSKLQVEVTGPYRIVQPGSGRTLAEGKRLPSSLLTLKGNGFQLGKQTFSGSQLEIIAQDPALVWCGSHGYRGSLRVTQTSGSALLPVNHVPLENYVASVVDSEMPTAFGPEARKAQAIVARSFALAQMRAAPGDRHFDLYATTRSQRYLGRQYRDSEGRFLSGESEESRRLTAATAGMVCTYKGAPFCPYYCAACGGRTILGTDLFPDAAAVHKSVPCQWCQPATLYRWEESMSRQAVEQKLRNYFSGKGAKLGPIRAIVARAPVRPGREAIFEVRDDHSTRLISAQDVRTLLGNQQLHSPQFSVELGRDSVQFHGRGSGHGVGLCQWGARGMAQQGKSVQQILAHYYPGSQISGQGGR